MKTYDLKKGDKIYVECSDGSTYVIFDHQDGMYSYCISEKGNKPVNINMGAEIIKFEDGYKII